MFIPDSYDAAKISSWPKPADKVSFVHIIVCFNGWLIRLAATELVGDIRVSLHIILHNLIQ